MTKKIKVVFFDTDDMTTDYIQEHIPEEVDVFFERKTLNDVTEKDLARYGDAEIVSVFTHAKRLLANKLDLFPNLKMISTRCTGFDHIDLDYTRKRGIVVTNVPNYGAITVAEYTMGLMMATARKIRLANSDLKTNKVQMDKYMGMDLYGKTLGVIGTGAIGRHVVQLATAFGMKVLVYDPYPSEAVKQMGAQYVSLPHIYTQSDIITLHCPATPENYHLLNKPTFQLMKQGVLIINTARGTLIDTKALYNAMKSGKVGGVGLDVLESEDVLTLREISTEEKQEGDSFLNSVINYKILQSEKAIITPHVAFNSLDAMYRILGMTLESITTFLQGKPAYVVAPRK